MKKTIRCHGRTIGYEAGGPDSGAAALLAFQPPGASGASIWRPVATAFQDRFRTVAVNPSAYGDTAPYEGPAPMTIRDEAEALAAAIRAELPKCAPDRTHDRVHVIGHSYGGTVALVLALEWPELVGRLTLLEPAPYPLLREAGDAELSAGIGGRNRSFIAAVRRGGRDAEAMERYMDYFNDRPGFWRSLDETAQARLAALAGILAISLDAVERLDVTLEDLGRITVPATVVRGGATDRLHARLAEIVAAAVPGATLTTLPGAAHMMTLTHGREVAELLETLLETP